MSDLGRRLAAVLMAAVFSVAGVISSAEAAGDPAAGRAAGEDGARVEGGLGVTWIDGEAFYNVRLQPEVALGNWGAGLNIDLLVSSKDGEIREADLKPQKLLRYIRYGHRRDPLYGRVGALDNSTLGHGILVYRYRNQLVENERKLGLEFGLWREGWTVELLTNNLQRSDLFGGRAAVAPLRGRLNVPLLSRILVGASYVREEDEDENGGNGSQTVEGIAFDLELPLVNRGPFRLWTYADWARLLDHGSGRTVGLGGELGGLAGLVDLSLLLERRWSGEHFEARYFDYFYEKERFDPVSGVRKSELLQATDANGEPVVAKRGEFVGELWLTVLGVVSIKGLYEFPDVEPRLGRLHLDGDLPSVRGIDLRAEYDRDGVEDARDLFDLDERSLLTMWGAYPLNRWTSLGIRYEWTFHQREYVDPNTGLVRTEIVTMKKVSPSLIFHVDL